MKHYCQECEEELSEEESTETICSECKMREYIERQQIFEKRFERS